MRLIVLIAAGLLLGACGGGGGGNRAPAQAPPPVAAPPPPPAAGPTSAQLAGAAKFLSLATFGPDHEAIRSAATEGLDVWLERQFTLGPSLHEPVVRRYLAQYGFDVNANPPPGTFRRFAFWEQALTAPDELRQLTAYALTQIMVVSDNVDAIAINPLALSSYYDTLLTHAFGNFRELLLAVTLHPAMGVYLSHVNNARSNPGENTFPDENYAREVMQLFSIGLFELNPDGSQRLGQDGRPLPTYDNGDIQEFAKIFTGLSYGPDRPGGASFFGKQLPVLHVPMVMFESFHEPGEKRLLRGEIVPAGRSGMEDIEAAVDNLFNHPNVGPFIGRQLIQRLVTSNPSPAYVSRVASAFAGDASTPRGDMQHLLRAILLDPEAAAGIRLQEPFRRYLAMNRALGVSSDDGTYPGLGYVVQFLTQQHVLSAPSVFNFYSPGFAPAGGVGDAGLVAPEFQITNASTIVGMTNLLAYALYGAGSIDTPPGFSTIRLDLSEYEGLAADPEALLDRIDLVFFAGELDAATRGVISDAITPVGADLPGRVRLALYLALSSPAYAVSGGA
ncbi:MAG: DUF1800 domain-containing protein [Pseudomonadales bacterium]|nr:DUF1800 domain-containing protein [Pseudomonadales bacterium]